MTELDKAAREGFLCYIGGNTWNIIQLSYLGMPMLETKGQFTLIADYFHHFFLLALFNITPISVYFVSFRNSRVTFTISVNMS